MRRRGVTLLEILVAIVILAIGAVTIFQIFPMAFVASNKSKAKTIAYELGAAKLEEARAESLFGGPQTDRDYYWGNSNAPNPDQNAFAKVNTAGAWRQFPSDPQYWYRVDAAPVVDPLRKYREFAYDRESGGGGFGSLYRLTVTVRGPLKSASDWSNVPVARRSAVEVVLATYISNKQLGDAVLARDAYYIRAPTDGNPANDGRMPTSSNAAAGTPVPVGGVTCSGGTDLSRSTAADNLMAGRELAVLYVRSADGSAARAEDFTVFNLHRLTGPERADTGPSYYRPDYPGADPDAIGYWRGMDALGLDNVTVFRSADVGGRYVAETNKVVGLLEPSGDGFPHDTQYWGILLQNCLSGYDNDTYHRSETQTAPHLSFVERGQTTGVMDDGADCATASASIDSGYANLGDPEWTRSPYGRPQYKGASLVNIGGVHYLGYPATQARVRFRLTVRTPP